VLWTEGGLPFFLVVGEGGHFPLGQWTVNFLCKFFFFVVVVLWMGGGGGAVESKEFPSS